MVFDVELPTQSLETEEVKLDTLDENQAIKDLEAQLQILEETRHRIETSKTVNKAQVQELNDECGLELNDDAPINSYTEEPSQTNLSVTIESIWSKTKNILATIVEKVREILKKIFDFIDGFLGKWLSKSKNYAKIKETLKEITMTREEFIAEANKHGVDFEKVVAAQTPEEAAAAIPEEVTSSEFKEAFDKLVAKGNSIAETWSDGYSDLLYYLFSGTSLTDGLSAVTIATQHSFDVLHKKLGSLVELSKELSQLKKANNVRSAIDKLNFISKPIEAEPFKAAAKLFDLENTAPPVDSMMDCAQYMTSVIQKLTESHALPVQGAEFFAKNYLVADKHHHNDVIFPAESIHRQIGKDKTLVSELVGKLGSADADSELIQAYQKAAASLIQEFNAAQNILFVVSQVNRTIYYFMSLAINMYENQLNKGMIIARCNKDESFLKKTEEMLDEFKRKYKSF